MSAAPDSRRTRGQRLGLAGLALALIAGAALRLAWPLDMEWKADEQWSYLHAQAMLASGGWPPMGMPSSVGPPNPGLSLWVFAGLDALVGVTSPPDLAHAVSCLNIAALLAFAAFGLTTPERGRREPWLWAAALWSVNPAAMIVERKIWPPSTLPIAAVALIWAWWYRRHPVAAVAWGAIGALMAQIHVGVTFFALALAAWTLIRDGRAFPWKGWLAGSVLGCLPAISWVQAMLARGAGAAATHARGHHPSVSFYERWVSQFFGYSAHYDIGGHDFAAYLRGPVVGGVSTWLMGAAQLALIAVALIVLARTLLALRRKGWMGWRAFFLGGSAETTLITASLWGYGGLLTLLTLVGAGSYRHYMIIIAPVIALWTAMAVFWGGEREGAGPWRPRALLTALVILQASMSFGLLDYIDRTGVIQGDFGASWKAQQAGRAPPPLPPPD